MAIEPKFRDKYGIKVPEETTDLALELACYRDIKGIPNPLKREIHMRNAFQLMWPKFRWNDWLEMFAWAWCKYRVISVMGHTRAGKTFGCAHFALLDYLAAPPVTASTMTTTKFDALKSRLWADLMRAIETCAQKESLNQLFKVTSTSNEMKFGMKGTPADAKYMIQGVAVDSGDTNASKLRGHHTDRRRIFVDEAQDVSSGIYSAFNNAISAEDFIGCLLTNPVEKISEYGDWSKPVGGWESITDTALHWETERGVCLHFDGLQSPNIKAGKTIFPQMMTQEYVDTIRKTSGEDSLEWWMYVRGFFPPDGVVARVWPNTAIIKAQETAEFDYPPVGVASLDPAFDHDDCAIILGVLGRRRNGKPCALAKSSIKININAGSAIPKDYQIAREVIRLCKENNIPPENMIMDETGNARGVLAILRTEWSIKVQGIAYGGEATKRPMRLDDAKPANELVKYFVSELWFRASNLAQEGMICGLNNLNSKTSADLNARRYTVRQFGEAKLRIVESKDELKKRLNRSPDFGDAFCGIGELMVRKGLLGDVSNSIMKNPWKEIKKRAIKAALRYSEEKEFAHG